MGAVFADASSVYEVIGGFLQQVTRDEEFRRKFVATDTSVHFIFTDPDTHLLFDCTIDPPVVTTAPDEVQSDIELHMTADDAHELFLGKLNVPVALAKGTVRVNGPVSKMTRLLHVMNLGARIYERFLAERDGPGATV